MTSPLPPDMPPAAGPSYTYVDRLRGEFERAPLALLVPLGEWIRQKPWNTRWARWFAIFAVAPFVLLQAAGELELQDIAWAFGAYFAAMWLIVLTLVIRPRGVSTSTFVAIGLFTVIVGTVLAVLLEGLFASVFVGDSFESSSNPFTNVFGVALPEEAIKLLPLYLFLYRGKGVVGPLTMAYAGALSGLAFGAAEAVAYSAEYTNQADAGYLASDDLVVAQVWRLVGAPMFHACLTGITGYFLGIARLHPSVTQALVLTGLALSIVLHGLYNSLAGGWGSTVIAVLTVLTFLSYIRTGEDISRRLAGAEQAGKGNPRHAGGGPPTETQASEGQGRAARGSV